MLYLHASDELHRQLLIPRDSREQTSLCIFVCSLLFLRASPSQLGLLRPCSLHRLLPRMKSSAPGELRCCGIRLRSARSSSKCKIFACARLALRSPRPHDPCPHARPILLHQKCDHAIGGNCSSSRCSLVPSVPLSLRSDQLELQFVLHRPTALLVCASLFTLARAGRCIVKHLRRHHPLGELSTCDR